MANKSVAVQIWQGMLEEGVCVSVIKDLVQKHIAGLKALSDSIEDRQLELERCDGFLKQLQTLD